MVTIEDMHKRRWQMYVAADWHPEWGFEQFFMLHPEIGSPLDIREDRLVDGRAVRNFANGTFAYGDNGVEPV